MASRRLPGYIRAGDVFNRCEQERGGPTSQTFRAQLGLQQLVLGSWLAALAAGGCRWSLCSACVYVHITDETSQGWNVKALLCRVCV